MGIPESQLITWSHQGATASSQETHESIRNALDASTSPIRDKDYEVYLQGSYKNSTNIRGDSDVDVVVQLKSTFRSDLSLLLEGEVSLYQSSYNDAEYLWKHFRADVLKALRAYYDSSSVSEGNKSIKVAGGPGRLPADVIVCLQYRKYLYFNSTESQSYTEGITFYALRDNRWIINYPKVHYNNGVNKHSRTNGKYKPTVRVFKNARTHLVDEGVISKDLAPSYFLECLLYNASDASFENDNQCTFLNVIQYLLHNLDACQCQSERSYLFGSTPEQWSKGKAIETLSKLIDLWRNW